MINFRNHAYFILLCLLVGCAGMVGTEEMYIPPATATPRPGGKLKTFHIRPDGGDTAQCTGQADQPYPSEGTGLDCACDHPFRALPPGGPSRIQGGDTLIIHSGDYAMGIDAIDGLNPDMCSPDYSWDCVMQDITIHGMGVHGIMSGRLSDWQVENLALVGNGWVGWEGDIDGDDSNSGTLDFSHWTVAWNGCVESYPPGRCWAAGRSRPAAMVMGWEPGRQAGTG